MEQNLAESHQSDIPFNYELNIQLLIATHKRLPQTIGRY